MWVAIIAGVVSVAGSLISSNQQSKQNDLQAELSQLQAEAQAESEQNQLLLQAIKLKQQQLVASQAKNTQRTAILAIAIVSGVALIGIMLSILFKKK